MKRIVVIGAGIGGLAAAHTIKKHRDEGNEVEVTLFESAQRAGGKILSERIDGFLCEYGPNSLLDNRPSAMKLIEEVGLKDKILNSNDDARKRYILANGKLHQLPEGPGSFMTTGLISFFGKIRIITELFRAQGDPDADETIEEFAKRRLGKEAYEKLLDPMITGIFAGDPTKMSLKTCFERIHELEMQYGGLFKAMMKLGKEKKKQGKKDDNAGPAGPGGTIVAFNDGLQEVIDALAADLKGIIRYNTQVTYISKADEGYTVGITKADGSTNELKYDSVIVCTPTHVMRGMLNNLSQPISDELAKIPYAPVAVIGVGFDKDGFNHPLDGFGFLIPKTEGRKILGCLWTSSIFAHRAPDGKVFLRLMIGGMRSPELVSLSDDELIELVLDELKITMGITAKPIFTNIYKHERAIIQFNVGHEKISSKIQWELKKFPGIYLGCNTYGGIGIDGAIKSSVAVAEEALS